MFLGYWVEGDSITTIAQYLDVHPNSVDTYVRRLRRLARAWHALHGTKYPERP